MHLTGHPMYVKVQKALSFALKVAVVRRGTLVALVAAVLLVALVAVVSLVAVVCITGWLVDHPRD